jgi:hypothetical protein
MQATLARALDYHRRGMLAEAQSAYQLLLAQDLGHFDALHMLGVLALQRKDPGTALDFIGKAIAIDAGHAAAYSNRGAAFRELGNFESALSDYDRALAIDSQDAEIHCSRGMLLEQMQRLEPALQSYDRAIALRADYWEAHFARANVLRRLDRPHEALLGYERALSYRRDAAELWHALGAAQLHLNQVDAAIISFDAAIARREGFAEAHWSRATALLLKGNLRDGFHHLEWRRQKPRRVVSEAPKPSPAPEWRGDVPVAGKTLLLRAEQGLGDSIQFCRYATLLAERGARVIVEADRRLVTLLSSLAGVSGVIATGEPLPLHDLHIPMMSLPCAFHTTLDDIPAPVRYLSAPSAAAEYWRVRLEGAPGLRVGLAWSGSALNGNDRYRSISLAALIAQLPAEIRYVSLQSQPRREDVEVLRYAPHIWDFSDDLGDFATTAGLCECLDLVVSVDSSMAHLSAALGKPTWILMPYAPDWRWMLAREDSPWYPTVRLFRQPAPLDWRAALAALATELRSWRPG